MTNDACFECGRLAQHEPHVVPVWRRVEKWLNLKNRQRILSTVYTVLSEKGFIQ